MIIVLKCNKRRNFLLLLFHLYLFNSPFEPASIRTRDINQDQKNPQIVRAIFWGNPIGKIHTCLLSGPTQEAHSHDSWCPANHPDTKGQKGHLGNLQVTSVGNDSGRLLEFHYQVTKLCSGRLLAQSKEETLSPLRMLRFLHYKAPNKISKQV